MITVQLIGAGQIGSRHLQGLARSDRVTRIEVLGRSAASLTVAEERYRQVARPGRQSVLFTRDEAELSDTVDVAIVATHSDNRFGVLEKLVTGRKVGAVILEKVVFQSAAEFDRATTLLSARRIPAWVNCFRRALPAYRQLRESLPRAWTLEVEGGEWGLGCNAVHYVDLCAFLGGSYTVHLDATSRLDAQVIAAKRAGFLEFTGRIDGRCGSGHRFHLIAHAGAPAPERMTIRAEDGTVLAEEAGAAVRTRGAESRIPYQSELTDKLVDEILQEGKSSLPTLEQSYRVHAPLLDLFSRHLEQTTGSPCLRCPIT